MFTAKTQGVSTWWAKTQDARETNLTRRSAGVFYYYSKSPCSKPAEGQSGALQEWIRYMSMRAGVVVTHGIGSYGLIPCAISETLAATPLPFSTRAERIVQPLVCAIHCVTKHSTKCSSILSCSQVFLLGGTWWCHNLAEPNTCMARRQ